MLNLRDEPNDNLLYLVAVFAIEPAHETRGLHGSLGRVGWDGDLEWHVEVVQARRDPHEYSSGAALAVVYLRIKEREWPNVVHEEEVQRAFELLEDLVAPMEWASERPLSLRILEASTYRGTGRSLGGAVYANIIYGAASGSLGHGAIDSAQLDQHPELRRAIRFYTRGVSAADERFYPDACINYARCIECIVGSTSNKPALKSACVTLNVDATEVIAFLDKTRNRYAIAHSLDRVRVGKSRLKDLPTQTVEQSARKLARNVVRSYISQLPPLDHSAEQRKGIRYQGLPPVKTNLPLAKEVLWAKLGPWEQAAPGMAPDLVPLTSLARRLGVAPARLRALVKRKLLRPYMRGHRLFVSSIMYEFYSALSRETGDDYRSKIFQRLSRAAEESGITVAELRDLVRQRRVHGWINHRMLKDVVDVDSLRYHLWRRRRRAVTAELGLPDRLGDELNPARNPPSR